MDAGLAGSRPRVRLGWLALGLLLGLVTISARGRAADVTPAKSASGITVTREKDETFPGHSSWVVAQEYAARQGTELLRAVQHGDRCLMLRSRDGGVTWGEEEVVAQETPLGDGRLRCTSIASLYLDPEHGRLVRFLSEVLAKSGSELAYGDAVGHGPHTGRLYYQISGDKGRTWTAPQQLIESGRGYDPQHWAHDVWYGRSALVIEGQTPYRLSDGTIVIPAYLWPTRRYMERLFAAQQWPRELWGDAPYFIEGRCLRLRWKSDLSGLEFTSGGPMRLPGGYTSAGTCGSDEPAVAYFDDRHWLSIVRTSTSHGDDFRQRGVPMLRQCLTTADGGQTWTEGRPLRFDDGGVVYSPSAWSLCQKSSRSGKWYWIGNVLSAPIYGNCDPRYPLQIVEIDPRRQCLKRATLTVIADKAPEDDPWVRFSNFRVYEERGTGDFILLLRQAYCEYAQPGLPTPSYRYCLRLPR